MSEQWRKIPGYEGAYEASNLGRVRSVDREIIGRWGPHLRRGRILREFVDQDGYLRVAPSLHGKARSVGVHRLVLLAFVGPRPDGYVALHADGNPANNSPSNLSWGTYSDNTFDAVAHGTHRQTRKTHCPQGHPYSAANTRMDGGSRKCKTCIRTRDAAYRLRKRQAQAKARAGAAA